MSFFTGKSKDKEIKRLTKIIATQEKVFNDTLKEVEEERGTYRKEMQKCLKENIDLNGKNKDLISKYNNLVNEYNNLKQNSIRITSRNRGDVITMEGDANRNKSRSKSSTKGGKSKKNKLKRNKYSVTKRKYV
jgi:hypothetical protein